MPDCKTVDPDDFAQMEFLSTPIAQVANNTDQYSLMSIQWLERIRQTADPDVQHALRYGEKKLEIFKVDGYSIQTRTAYEFQGCIWHGHGCMKTNHHLNRAMRKKVYIESQGLKYVCT